MYLHVYSVILGRQGDCGCFGDANLNSPVCYRDSILFIIACILLLVFQQHSKQRSRQHVGLWKCALGSSMNILKRVGHAPFLCTLCCRRTRRLECHIPLLSLCSSKGSLLFSSTFCCSMQGAVLKSM